MKLLFTIPIKITSMIHITRQVIIAHTGNFAVRICRQMTRVIFPVAAGTIEHRSAITLSPRGFIKNNGYREVL